VIMANPDTQPKPLASGTVKPLPQTIFISEKKGAEPAPVQEER